MEAQAFADGEGNLRVLIAGVGPGTSKATITISDYPDLSSQFGASTNLGAGQYEFEGTDVCSDILGNNL